LLRAARIISKDTANRVNSGHRNSSMVARVGPVVQHLGPCNQAAILNLLRGSGQPGCPEPPLGAISPQDLDSASCVASAAAQWTAGVYVAEQLTSFVQACDSQFDGPVEITLFVGANWRRQGIGTLLLKAAIDWASHRQASALRFVCARTNWPMRHFAEKFGARLDLVLGQIVADIPLGQVSDVRQRTPSQPA
jgi:GNAT superfamily N-acetyltransferase